MVKWAGMVSGFSRNIRAALIACSRRRFSHHQMAQRSVGDSLYDLRKTIVEVGMRSERTYSGTIPIVPSHVSTN